MALLGLAGAGANILGGVIGNVASSNDRQQAKELQQQALQNILNVNNPTASDLKVALQKYLTPEQVTPELEQTINQGSSQLNNISTDPRLRNAQIQALQTMQKVGEGGLRPEDLAALNQIKQSVNQQEQGNEQAILQSMQQRGIGGSGAELAAKLSSAQNAANMANNQDMNIGAQASARALQAISNSGNLSQAMEGQQFGEQAQIANAQDVINRYNAMNQQQVGNANTATQNQAQYYNVGNQNQTLQANTQLTNQQTMYNTNAQQQAYQDALQKASASAGVTNQAANADNQSAAQTQSLYSGLGQAVGQGLAAYGNYKTNQANQQQNSNNYMNTLMGNGA